MSQNHSKEESFMSMYNDIVRGDPHNERVCLANSTLWLNMQRSSLWVIGHSSDQGQKRNGMRQTLSGLEENGTESLSSWWLISVRVDIPHFVPQVRWNKELCKVKEVERYPQISVGTMTMLNLFFRTIVSVNQLSVNGAVFVRGIHSSIKLVSQWTNQSNWFYVLIGWTFKDHFWPVSLHRATCCSITRRVWKHLPDDEQLIKLCTDAGFIKTVAPGTVFFDERCWRVLTIWWSCGMSRENFTLRRRIIKTKRMEVWRCKDWSSIASGDQLLSRSARSWD